MVQILPDKDGIFRQLKGIALEATIEGDTKQTTKIIGIDPARTTGYGIIDTRWGDDLTLISCGEMLDRTKKIDILDRMKILMARGKEIIAHEKPDIMAIETGFLGINRNTSLRLAEIRGMFKTLALQANVEIFEFHPTHIRKTVCGKGNAKKDEMKRAVIRYFPHLETTVSEDVTDAIGAAICLVKSIEWD